MNFLLITVLSLDMFFACMAYGYKNILIPNKSKAVIALVSTVFLACSMMLGGILHYILPSEIIHVVGFTVLFAMGCLDLFESIIKQTVKKRRSSKTICFQYSDFSLVVDIYIDKTKADTDNSKILSCYEALFLAIPLSLDSLFTGLSIITEWRSAIVLLFYSAVSGFIAAAIGTHIGQISNAHKDYTWLSGIILIILAFFKLI